MKIEQIGPYPFSLSPLRVTDEEAEVIQLSDHFILNYPNQIGPGDFENWVQERGLYFAENWDKKYSPLFSMSDHGEEALKGSTLVCEYGNGTFIYTGISFFRQLEAGVPGAFRLFTNFIEYGQNRKSK